MLKEMKEKVLTGQLLLREELLTLLEEDVKELSKASEEIREKCCGNEFDLCTIINGKCGKCSEDCKYCAQSAHYETQIKEHGIIQPEEALSSAKSNHKSGVQRFAVVTSGKRLTLDETKQLCEIYKMIKDNCKIKLCASHGLLSYEQFLLLKDAGVIRYHNNLETSRRFFPSICTTHTYDEKINTIKAAKRAGLQVCSGGILGLGETMEDRIDMALQLRELEVDSIPLNVLNPIKGTPLESQKVLNYDEIVKSIALFRFTLPTTQIRLAGGRGLFGDKGKRALASGINGAISGDMLTTSGIRTEDDIKMIQEMGFRL
ncbi:biotin synthase [Lachnospiraceae bacterium KM106-2]|nr:biotin synthase [Lachnospiraceae bacterium KM106-2]